MSAELSPRRPWRRSTAAPPVRLDGPLGLKRCTQPTRLARTVWAASRRLFVLFQSSGKLEKAEILEMTVQYLRTLHSADFPRGREKGGQGVCATQSPAGGSGSKAVSQGLLSECCRGGAPSPEKAKGDWRTGVWGYRF